MSKSRGTDTYQVLARMLVRATGIEYPRAAEVMNAYVRFERDEKGSSWSKIKTQARNAISNKNWSILGLTPEEVGCLTKK